MFRFNSLDLVVTLGVIALLVLSVSVPPAVISAFVWLIAPRLGIDVSFMTLFSVLAALNGGLIMHFLLKERP